MFMDYTQERCAQAGIPAPQVFVLDGGINNWVGAGPEFLMFMEGLEPSHWMGGQKQGTKRRSTGDCEEDNSPTKRNREAHMDIDTWLVGSRM